MYCTFMTSIAESAETTHMASTERGIVTATMESTATESTHVASTSAVASAATATESTSAVASAATATTARIRSYWQSEGI